MGAAGTDAALETADIALMGDDLAAVPDTIRLARRTTRVIWQNIVFSIAVKALFLVLAPLGLVTLWLAVFADMGTSLLVTATACACSGAERPRQEEDRDRHHLHQARLPVLHGRAATTSSPRGVEYDEIDVTTTPGAQEQLAELTCGSMIVPVIVEEDGAVQVAAGGG